MKHRGSDAAGLKRLALYVALAAIILRALMPAGFMPLPGSGRLVICTGQGLAEAPRDEQGHKPAAAPDGTCLFAGQANAAPPPASVSVAAVAFPMRIARVLGRAESIMPGRGLAAPPPPQTAPPSLI